MKVKDGSGGPGDIDTLLDQMSDLTRRMGLTLEGLAEIKIQPEAGPEDDEDLYQVEAPPPQFSDDEASTVHARVRRDDSVNVVDVRYDDDLGLDDLDLIEEGLSGNVDPEVLKHYTVEDMLDEAYGGDLSPIRGEDWQGEGGGGGKGGRMDELLRKAAFRTYKEGMESHAEAEGSADFFQGEEDWHLKFREGARRSTDEDVRFHEIADEIALRETMSREYERTAAMDGQAMRDYLDDEYYRNRN